MANIIEPNIKQLNAELARTTKPKAYVQFYCDPDGYIITAYDRDTTTIEDSREYEVFELTFITGADTTDDEFEDAYDRALSLVASLLMKHGWSPEFNSLEDLHAREVDPAGVHRPTVVGRKQNARR